MRRSSDKTRMVDDVVRWKTPRKRSEPESEAELSMYTGLLEIDILLNVDRLVGKGVGMMSSLGLTCHVYHQQIYLSLESPLATNIPPLFQQISLSLPF